MASSICWLPSRLGMHLSVLSILLARSLAYLDLGHPHSFYSLHHTYHQNYHNPQATVARHINLPQGWDPLDHHDEKLPSHITAIAPSTTVAANGSFATMYSIHYNSFFARNRQGVGVFDKRGVFADDPPIATCTPCGGVGYSTSGVNVSAYAAPTCTTHLYNVSWAPEASAANAMEIQLISDSWFPGRVPVFSRSRDEQARKLLL